MKKKILIALVVVAAFLSLGLAPLINTSLTATLNATPEVVVSTLTTTKVEPFTALATTPENQQVRQWVQKVTVINMDATGHVCLAVTTWATACTAVTFSCLGAASGTLVRAGATREFSFTGEGKICAVANEAATDVVFERALLHAL